MQDKKKAYHHKDLRNALIEKSIEIVSSEGVQSFSLRKAAAACGVSHAAPYKHFQNKEELLGAMQEHITERFSSLLEEVIKKYGGTPVLLKKMGLAYVDFFIENPTYFLFLYTQSDIVIDLQCQTPEKENYRPYMLYKTAVISILEQVHYPLEKQNDVVISLWAFIHGIASLATMSNVRYENWEQKVTDFMDMLQPAFLKNAEGFL